MINLLTNGSLLIGLCFVIWGLRLAKLYISLIGFCAGTALGGLIGLWLSEGQGWAGVFGAVVGAVLVASIAWTASKTLFAIIVGWWTMLITWAVIALVKLPRAASGVISGNEILWLYDLQRSMGSGSEGQLMLFIIVGGFAVALPFGIGAMLAWEYYETLIVIMMGLSGSHAVLSVAANNATAISQFGAAALIQANSPSDYLETLLRPYTSHFLLSLVVSILFVWFALRCHAATKRVEQSDGAEGSNAPLWRNTLVRSACLFGLLSIFVDGTQKILGPWFWASGWYGVNLVSWPLVSIVVARSCFCFAAPQPSIRRWTDRWWKQCILLSVVLFLAPPLISWMLFSVSMEQVAPFCRHTNLSPTFLTVVRGVFALVVMPMFVYFICVPQRTTFRASLNC